MNARLRRAQTAADWTVCRALVPGAARSTSGPIEGLILVPESGPRAGGAAVLRYDDSDAWLAMTVVPPLRRRGLGSFLLQAALKRAADAGARRMVASYDTVAEPAAEPFLRASGFSASIGITTFEADFESAAARVCGYRDQLAARGRIPASWSVKPLAEAPVEYVVRLFAEYIAHRRDLADAPLQLDRETGRWDRSPVLLDNGEPFAAVFFEHSDDVWSIEGRFVAEGYRGGVANAALIGAAVDVGRNLGVRSFRFTSQDDNRDTLKLAQRIGAQPIKVRTRFERPLVY